MDIDTATPADWAIADITKAILEDLATVMPMAQGVDHRERQIEILREIGYRICLLLGGQR